MFCSVGDSILLSSGFSSIQGSIQCSLRVSLARSRFRFRSILVRSRVRFGGVQFRSFRDSVRCGPSSGQISIIYI